MTTDFDDEELQGQALQGMMLSDADALVDTTLALTDLLHDDPDEALRRIAGELRDLTGSRTSAIYVLEDRVLRPLVVNEHGRPLVDLAGRAWPLAKHDLAEAAVSSGRPLAVNGYGPLICKLSRPEEDEQSYASGILLPTLMHDEVVGMVELCDSVERDYNDARGVADRLVRIAARATVWSEEFKRTRARDQVARELLQLGDLIARARSLSELVKPIAANLREVIDAEDCDIWQANGDLITCLGSYDRNGWDESVIGDSYYLSDYPAYHAVVALGEVKVIPTSSDPALSDRERQSFEKWGYRSNLCLPLSVEGRTLGFIDIYDTRERDYAEHLDWASNVGRLLAGAFDKVLLLDRLERSARDIRVLLDIGHTFTAARVFEDALQKVAEQTATTLGLQACRVLEFVEDLDALVPRAAYDAEDSLSEEELGVPRKLGDHPADRVILLGGQIVVEHVSDPLLDDVARESMERWGETTCLNIPMAIKGTPLGVIMVTGTGEERHFTDSELDLAAAIGEQVALALQTSRLGRALKQQTETDTATGLATSRHFRQRAVEEVARASRHGLPISALAIEIDDFRAFNVEHGREAGLDLVSAVADVIQVRVHPFVDLGGRYSGGKFALLLPNTPLQGEAFGSLAAGAAPDSEGDQAGPHVHGALGVGERIRTDVEAMTRVGDITLERSVTVSVGVAELTPAMSDADALLGAADLALAYARQHGKNRVDAPE